MQTSNSTTPIFLITLATGSVGVATVRNLLENGHRVRAITRRPETPSSLTPLAQKYPNHLEIVKADYSDPASLEPVLSGITGVLSIQSASVVDIEPEVGYAKLLIDFAKRAGVKNFVQITVNRAGYHEQFPDWHTGRWATAYWVAKSEVQKAVREAGFESYTILKPVIFMEDFIPPKSDFMFAGIEKGEVSTVIKEETKLQLVGVDDIAKFVRAAFENPTRYNKKEIDLIGDEMTSKEVFEIYGKGLKKDVKVTRLTPEEAKQVGFLDFLSVVYQWVNEWGYNADKDSLREYGIPLTSFKEWVETHVGK